MLQRLFVLLGTTACLPGLGATSQAHAQTLSPEAAPVEWVRYAEAATLSVQSWLEEQSEAASRIRSYLDASRPAPDKPTTPLVLRLWVDGTGRVSRIVHDPLGPPAEERDFERVVVGRQLKVPPRRMLQPMLIAVQIPPAEPDVRAQGGGA